MSVLRALLLEANFWTPCALQIVGRVSFPYPRPPVVAPLQFSTRSLATEYLCFFFVSNASRTEHDTTTFSRPLAIHLQALSIASAVAATGNGGGGEAATAALSARHSPEGFPRALAALRLTRLFAARIVSTLGASQVRAQFYSRGSWRDGDRPSGGRSAGGGAAVGVAGGRGAAAAAAATGRASSGGGGGGAITEGQEEAPEQNAVAGAAAAPADPVTALLSSIMSLLCASGDEGGMAGRSPRRRNGGRAGGGGGVLSVEGFSDLQLEAVGLLLVLLGTQAYGPRPPAWDSSPGRATNGGELCGGGWEAETRMG